MSTSSARQPGETVFMLIADPQFGMFAHYSGRTPEEAAEIRARGMPVEPVPKFEHWEQEKRLFGAAIQEANRLRPDFVVVAGDMVMQWDNTAQVESVREVASGLDPGIPLYWVPGNHDLGIDNYTPTAESLAAYRATYGRDYYSFTHATTQFVVINSPLFDKPEQVRGEFQQELTWLRSTLSRRPVDAERAVILSHHPLFLSYPAEEDQVFNLPLERRRILLDLFLQAGVSAMFTGHTHRNVRARYGGLEVVAAGAVGLNRMGDRSGYLLASVSPEAVRHAYYTLPG